MALDSHQDTLKLYEIAANDERMMFDRYQKSVAFHFSAVAAILAGTVAGIIQATQSYHLYFLLSGPVLIVIASFIGSRGTTRLYRGWLENVTTRAKLEQDLGLTQPRMAPLKGYWKQEPVEFERNIRTRSEASSSREFVERRVRSGYQRFVRVLFWGFAGIALLVFMGIVCVLRAGLPVTANPSFTSTFMMEYLGIVYPFPVAGHEPDDPAVNARLNNVVSVVLDNLSRNEVKCLLLVGRTDKRDLLPRLRRVYGSNNGLAEARARWVKGRLPVDLSKVPVVVLVSGPTNIGSQVSPDGMAQDRSVEVYMCGEKHK